MEGRNQERSGPRMAAKAALLGVSCLAALLVAEGAFRALKLAPQINRINPGMAKTVYRLSDNPVLGYVFKENYRDWDNPDLKSSYPYINAHGFRDRERTVEKPPGTRRIILLGDSVVAGSNSIRDHALTISGQLEDKYAAVAGGPMEVLNFGINGYCTRAEVEMLKEKGLQFDPDLVILVFVQNDYLNINADLGKVDLKQPWIVQKLFVYSHLFRRLALGWNLFNLRAAHGVNDFAGEWIGFLPANAEKVRQVREGGEAGVETLKAHLEGIGDNNVAAGLAMLRQLSEEHGFKVAVGIWPAFLKEGIVDVESVRHGEHYAVRPDEQLLVERLAAEQGFATFRFAPFFHGDFARRREQAGQGTLALPDLYSVDGMHATETGADVAARAIAKILTDNPGLIGAGTGAPAGR